MLETNDRVLLLGQYLMCRRILVCKAWTSKSGQFVSFIKHASIIVIILIRYDYNFDLNLQKVEAY